MLADRRYCYPLTITDFASRYLLQLRSALDDAGALCLHRLRARLQGLRPARGDPHRQRRAVRVAQRALRPEQAVGLVAAPRHSDRAHQARASRAERAARADASHPQDGSHQARRRQRPAAAGALRCLPRRASTTSGRIRPWTCTCPASSTRRRRGPIAGLADLAYPFHDWTAVVTHCGRICFDRRKVNLSQVFAGQQVGVRQVTDRIWLVSFMDYDLGYFDDETCRLEPIENPFGPKVLPMSPE